jgi:hypothetical protein
MSKANAGGFALDLFERVLATYGEAYIGLMIASGLGAQYVVDMSNANKALVAALPALAALVKGAIAKYLGNRQSAALLPAAAEPTAPAERF